MADARLLAVPNGFDGAWIDLINLPSICNEIFGQPWFI
jgi:hypothetical protein